MSDVIWRDTYLQLSRLIAEINAVGLTSDQIQGLCESMDLHPDDLNELFERANTLWEVGKSNTLGESQVHVNCPNCDEGVLDQTAVNDDGYELTCPNCGAYVLIDDNGFVTLGE